MELLQSCTVFFSTNACCCGIVRAFPEHNAVYLAERLALWSCLEVFYQCSSLVLGNGVAYYEDMVPLDFCSYTIKDLAHCAS